MGDIEQYFLFIKFNSRQHSLIVCSRKRVAASSRSCIKCTQWRLTGRGTRLGVLAPCEQRIRALRVKNGLISCLWHHLLKEWGLHETRDGSFLNLFELLLFSL